MENIFLILKISKKTKLVVNIPYAKNLQVYNIADILLKYNQHLDSIDNKIVINLELQSFKNTRD